MGMDVVSQRSSTAQPISASHPAITPCKRLCDTSDDQPVSSQPPIHGMSCGTPAKKCKTTPTTPSSVLKVCTLQLYNTYSSLLVISTLLRFHCLEYMQISHVRGRRLMRHYQVHSPYKRVVKTMRYNKASYTARKILKSAPLSNATITEIARTVKFECVKLCKTVPSPSNFCVKTTSDLLEFDWEPLLQELEKSAPVLTSILKAAAEGSTHGQLHPAGLVMAASILLKSRCQRMCKVQMVVSSLLYAGHASKKVTCYCILHL